VGHCDGEKDKMLARDNALQKIIKRAQLPFSLFLEMQDDYSLQESLFSLTSKTYTNFKK